MATSARGLFRATGKTSSIGTLAGEDLAGAYERPELLEREADDFYPTPPEPTRAFLLAECERLAKFPSIWEPAAGDGAMVREMRSIGLEVFASDLIDRGSAAEIKSFYDYRSAPSVAVVTNPPYAETNRDPGWIRYGLEALRLHYMALLLPINWFGAAGRAMLWAQFPPARVYMMRWRIDWTGQGAPPMLNCWVVWDSEHKGEPVLRMLDRPSDKDQLGLFEAAP